MYTQRSRNWYREQAQNVSKNFDEERLMKTERDRFRGWPVPGKLYLFMYDPKLKDKLPYYDRLPLVFPISMSSDSFIGLNMHYLPHPLRAKLMDALYPYLSNDQLDSTTQLQISFKILKAVARLAPYKPCVKKYLRTHVRSRFVLIDVKEWDIALFLPLERFEKSTTRHVWADSTAAINKLKVSRARGFRSAR